MAEAAVAGSSPARPATQTATEPTAAGPRQGDASCGGPAADGAGPRRGAGGGRGSLSGGPAAEDAAAGAEAALLRYFEEVQEAERRRRGSDARASEALNSIFGPEVRLVKASSVGHRMIFVIDGLLSAQLRAQLFRDLETDAYRRTEFARQETREYRHHVVEYDPERLRRSELFVLVDRLVRLLFPPSVLGAPGEPVPDLEVYRIYTNALTFGDAAFVHRDALSDEHVTVLVYPNPKWAPELGGETVFYTEDGDIAQAVEPRPGRVALFNGSIMHKGSPPSRLFWGVRYTMAFKYAPPEETDEGEDEG